MARVDIEPRELFSISVQDALHGWHGGNKSDLARAAGVSPRTIGRAIEGTTEHKPATIHNLIKATERVPEIQRAFLQLLCPGEVEVFDAQTAKQTLFRENFPYADSTPPLQQEPETVIIKP